MPEDQEPSKVMTPAEQFGRELQRFREEHGNPAMRRIEQLAHGLLSMASIHQLVRGRSRLMPWTRVELFLRACAAASDSGDITEDELAKWRAKYDKLKSIENHPSRVQQNIFQEDKEYTYVSGDQVVVGHGDQAVGWHFVGPVTVNESKFGTTAKRDSESAVEYLSGLEKEISQVARQARARLLAYRILRFLILVTSALTPALALLKAAPWITASVAATAFLAEGSIQLTRLNDRALLDVQRATLLNREFRMYRTQVGDYSSASAFKFLVQKIEEVRQTNDSERLGVMQQSFGSIGKDSNGEARPSNNMPG